MAAAKNHQKYFDQIPEVTHKNVMLDGVLRYPSTGLKVIVVGGGPGGYFAALECWRKGHDVELVEKNDSNSPIGDVVFLSPSGLSTLKFYPRMIEAYQQHSWDCITTYRHLSGDLVAPPIEFEWNRPEVQQHAAWPLRIRTMVSRAGLASTFYDQCNRLGIPIRFGVNIVDYAENAASKTATAIAKDGRRFTGDIVVAADGLGTRSHKAIIGEQIRAVPTGFAIARVFYSVDEIKSQTLREHLKALKRPDLRGHSGDGFHCIIVVANDSVFIALTSPDDGSADESWSKSISADDILARLPNPEQWDPLIIDMIRNIPESKLISWKLCWRNPQTKWTSSGGRIIQLGDSAHAFIPSSIMGATTALEDAQSLAECLRIAGNKNADVGTKVHEILRGSPFSSA
ncbi:hypothetical protein N7449_008552 [Penicillium cf. viridicatum]|uniref:FAD-binding domain-containing protein n=1 Tax=Penicillium cf. viridicatum TaxID=2972119 RepID=A0A9W9J8Q6_9EURO|nr:hypothetical protein N7449_008552 [Penicillium cf. viridicatum]